MNIIWQYLSISANKKLVVDIDSVMLCTYNKENQIFTLISTIVKSNLLPASMMEKYLTQLNVGIRYYTIKIQRN